MMRRADGAFWATLTASLVLALATAGCAGRVSATPVGAQDANPGSLADAAAPGEPPAIDELPLEPAGEPQLVAEIPDEVETADIAECAPVAEPAPDPAKLVTDALEACESAENFWEQGDMDEALAALDRAYDLLVEIPGDDPDLVQQKNDLRHLVSRRVVEIYRSRLTSAAEPGSPIPVEINAYVESEIRRFQGPEREFFLESYRRSGQYRTMIVRMLADAGMPEELSWLPLVESGFKTRALSRARALGMWQFISSTGYRFGLNRSHWIDERMDPEESTRAAIDYLSELHGMFGDWMTALAGYNCGEHRVASAIRRQQSGYLDQFWDLFEQLPRETARYVPRFLATLAIVRDPEAYGFELPDPMPPLAWETVPIERHARLDDLDEALGLAKGTITALNPALRRGITPAERYELRIPPAAAPSFDDKLAALAPYVPPEELYVIHRVRRGETLSRIAQRYGTTVTAIVRSNDLRSRHRIWPGQQLKIPGAGGGIAAAVAAGDGSRNLTVSVRRGDSLWRLASRYGTTVERIKRDNGLRSDRLYVGQTLRINRGAPPGARTYAVRRGDTLGKIAGAHHVSLSAVLRANGLTRRSTIYPGQVLVIPD